MPQLPTEENIAELRTRLLKLLSASGEVSRQYHCQYSFYLINTNGILGELLFKKVPYTLETRRELDSKESAIVSEIFTEDVQVKN